MTTAPTPKASIMKIEPYVGGKSKAPGVARVIKLSSNENPWGPSPKAIQAFAEEATHLNRYPDGGHFALREAIGKLHHFPVEQLICGAGSDELLGLLTHAFAGEGDEVLYSVHGFLMYKIYTLAAGATPVSAPEKDLHTDVDALLAAVTPRTKIVFVANPNNPTGTVIPFSEIRRLRAGLPEQVILGLDAAYAEYIDDPAYEAGESLVNEGTNTVVFHTFSKIYGLPALRLGWAFGPAAIIDAMNRIRSPFNVNSAALAAGVAALNDQEYIRDMRIRNADELKRLRHSLKPLGYEYVPSAANFLLVKFGAEEVPIINRFLRHEGLIVREVDAYGLPDYLRISIGTTEENTLLIDALTRYKHDKK